MKEIGKINEYSVIKLTKEIARNNIEDLLKILNQIPKVTYEAEEILADTKNDLPLLGKWEHSLAVFDGSKVIGVIFGQERRSEETEYYPSNTLYISGFGVSGDYQKQGIGKGLLTSFIKYNSETGFIYVSGKFNFSVQTNLADFNSHVVNLYKGVGFESRTTKKYHNREDYVMGLED